MKHKTISRRQWLAMAARYGFATGAWLSFPQITKATSAKVAIIGGGFGGATAARYIKRRNPAIHVTLIEANKTYYTCPFSNLYLAGLRHYEDQEQSYQGLKALGVEVIHEVAEAVHIEQQSIQLRNHRQQIHYDKLLMAPGIDMQWNALEGYDKEAALLAPHAWQGGAQTQLLKKQLDAMQDGGTFIMVIPDNPFRCPPGPYERASLIAHYLSQHKPRSKILLLDAKDDFSKKELFLQAWQSLYGNRIEWVPFSKDGKAMRIDAKKKQVETAFGQLHQADVLNVIPPQMAGYIAQQAGLTNQSGWVPIDPHYFQSLANSNIYVVGDATIASPMPKSGFAANTQAKVAAAAIVNSLMDLPNEKTILANTCYSLIAPDYGISVGHLYAMENEKLTERSGGVSPLNAEPAFRHLEAQYGSDWYKSITHDVWMTAS